MESGLSLALPEGVEVLLLLDGLPLVPAARMAGDLVATIEDVSGTSRIAP